MGVDADVDRVCIICLIAFSIGRMLSSYVTSPLELIMTPKCFILDTFFMPVALTMWSMFCWVMLTGMNMHFFRFKDRPDTSLYCCIFIISCRISCGLPPFNGIRLSSAKKTGLKGVCVYNRRVCNQMIEWGYTAVHCN